MSINWESLPTGNDLTNLASLLGMKRRFFGLETDRMLQRRIFKKEGRV